MGKLLKDWAPDANKEGSSLCVCSLGAKCERLGDRYKHAFEVFEWLSVAIFTIEYILRRWSCIEDPKVR